MQILERGRPSPLATPATTGEFATVHVNDLRVGVVLRTAVHDPDRPNSPLLLSAGTRLTDNVIQLLLKRGVTRVRIASDELKRLTEAPATFRAPTRKIEIPRAGSTYETAKPGTPAGWKDSKESFVRQLQLRPGYHKSPERATYFDKSFSQSLIQIDQVFQNVADKQIVDTPRVLSVSNEHLRLLTADFDLFVEQAAQPVIGSYPSKHALQTAMLATAMGTLMGLKGDELIDLNVGCLVHDAGMLKVFEKIKGLSNPSQTAMHIELMKHPGYISDTLGKSMNIPHGAMLVAYQMHERMDGSGYPRRRQGPQIHPLARIAAVADTFLSMVSPRNHRPGLLPYEAAENILFATRGGQFDPAAVRALLHTVSLFPVGSNVELSNGEIGKIVKANRANFTRPIVEVRGADGTTRILDLEQQPDLEVVRAIDLDGDIAHQFEWEN